jgi:N-acetyl-anhydromuramyl-L-alanine amidase AmpD
MIDFETIIDVAIRDRWHDGFERERPPDTIVIHGTGGPGTYQFVLDGGRKKLYKEGIALFHYLIERDGKIIEIIDPDRWVYHSSSGKHDEKTIGIELLNNDKDNQDQYTNAQYESLFFLIFDYLFSRYRIRIIASHNRMKEKYSGGNKKCPGNFDWDKLETEFKKRRLSYHHDNRYESYWDIENDRRGQD